MSGLFRILLLLACFLGTQGAAFADLTAWQTMVSAGTPAVPHFTTVAGTSPIRLNVETFAFGAARSFDFVYLGTGNGVSNTLLGSQYPAAGKVGWWLLWHKCGLAQVAKMSKSANQLPFY